MLDGTNQTSFLDENVSLGIPVGHFYIRVLDVQMSVQIIHDVSKS